MENNSNLDPNPYPNNIPNPHPLNSNPHQNPKSARATMKSVKYKGVWVKRYKEKKQKEKKEQRIRFGVEISHTSITTQNRKIWLGTYNTPEEGALAYDLASFRIKGRVPNQTIGNNGEIKISMSQEMKVNNFFSFFYLLVSI